MDDPRIQTALLPRERVLWSGYPGGGIRFSGQDFYLIPFSLLWGGFAIFWEVSAVRDSAGDAGGLPFDLFGAAFVAMGLFIMVGRFFLDAWLRNRIAYAVTDQRVLVLRGGGATVIPLSGSVPTSLSTGRDATGTIRFGEAISFFSAARSRNMANGFGLWLPSLDPTPQFLHIANAAEVFRIIQTQQAKG